MEVTWFPTIRESNMLQNGQTLRHHDNIFSFSKPGGIYTQNTYKIPQNALVKRRQRVMLSFL